MQRINLPLFRKFAFSIIAIVILFGCVNVILLWQSTFKLFNYEVNQRLQLVARVLSEKAVEPILYDDIVNLYKVLEGISNADTSIIYIVVINQNDKLVAFTSQFRELPAFTRNLSGSELHEPIFRSMYSPEKQFYIREITYPVLSGELGFLKIGIREKNIRHELIKSGKNLIFMILVFLFVGLLSAFIFSYLISKPIKDIVRFSRRVDFSTLKREFKPGKVWGKKLFGFQLYDELDMLNEEFENMYSRLKKSHKDLKKSQEALMHAEKLTAVGTLTAGLTHEINNPLTGLKYAIKRIEKAPDDIIKNKQYFKLMSEAITRISTVVSGLLDYSKKHDFIIQDIDIAKLIDRALSLVEYRFKKSQIAVIKEYPNTIEKIKGSNNHLEQVLLNLFINSIDSINEKKFPDKMRGIVKIVLLNKPTYLELWIVDNGIGLEPQKLKNIFDPFFTEKKSKNGTGLGLSISYKIIEDHNGTIEAMQNEFGGLTFLITLPK